MNDILDNQPPKDHRDAEQPTWQALQKAKDDVFDALCNSFNTPSAMRIISELISEYNSVDKNSITTEETLEIARWVTSIVNMFGLNGSAKPDDTSIGWSGIGVPEYAKPYLASISRMRDTLRQQARAPDRLHAKTLKDITRLTPASPGIAEAAPFQAVLSKFQADISSLKDSERLSRDILELSDRIRNVELWNLGIYLEDRADGQPALIRPVTKELRSAKAEQEAREEQKRKAKALREKDAPNVKADKGKLSHLDIFKTQEYSAWDDEGLPLKDAAGEEITKSKSKKLRKDWERQKKLHEVWLKANSS